MPLWKCLLSWIGLSPKTEGDGYRFILMEELICRHIHRLFPGMSLKNVISFRVTRNHDYDLHENEVLDLYNR